MELHNLKYAQGSRKNRKRIARGEGSGHGGTATRGSNGQKSRSGSKYRAWFEGGQMPLARRVPKRGFTNHFRVEYQAVNLCAIQNLVDDGKVKEGELIGPETLLKNGLINKIDTLYKILATGDLKAKLDFKAYKFSASAKEKIESANGTINEIKS